MKLVLALEIIFVLVKYASGTNCTFPYGLHVSELGMVYTISCSDPKSGFHFSKQIRNFLKFERFYRVICDEDGEIKFMNENSDDVVFCADATCDVPDSSNFTTIFNLYLNNSVITSLDQSEIYYCIQNEWYSLFETSLPKDLQDINNRVVVTEPPPTHLPWSLIKKLSFQHINKKLSNRKVVTNDINIKFIKPHKLQHQPVNSDLCGIAIICAVICSFLFLITFILIFTSKIAQKNQIRQRFLGPNSVCISSTKPVECQKDPISVDNGTSGKTEISRISKNRGCENSHGKTEYVSPTQNREACRLVLEH